MWLRKSTLLDLTERNANHIVPVSCRSLVDRCGSLGSCKPQIYFLFFIIVDKNVKPRKRRRAGYCIVLYWWCGHCCDLFTSIVLPRITRTWICWLYFAQRPVFFSWGSLTSLKFQNQDSQLKVPPGGPVLSIFTSWKNASTTAGFEPENPGSRGEHVTSRPPRRLREWYRTGTRKKERTSMFSIKLDLH